MLTEKDYCDYETCVALKELGFNQYHSHRTYAGEGGVWILDFEGEPDYNEGELILQEDLFGVPTDGNEVAAPLLYEVQKWLREERHLHIEIRWFSNLWYEYEVKEAEGKILAEGSAFPTYEEALSTAVRMAVEYLKEK